jgi:uncharacterized membrane protein YuzA (DUF378 family)
MEMTTKQKLAGAYVTISLLALTGEVSEDSSLFVFFAYYLIGMANFYTATKIFNNVFKTEKNDNATDGNRIP